LAEVVEMSRGIIFQVRIVLTKKEYRKTFMEEVKHQIVKECDLVETSFN